MTRLYCFFRFWRARPAMTFGMPLSAKAAWKLAKEAAKQ
jgi:hypothetical protein